jgi:hypothetical protein
MRNPNFLDSDEILDCIQYDVLEYLLLGDLSPAMRTIALYWNKRGAEGLLADYIESLVEHLVDRVPEIAELAEHVRDELGTVRGLCPAMETRLAIEEAEGIVAEAA